MSYKLNALKHGMSRHPFYMAWIDMRRRCSNTKSKDWPRYGGRGISVCESWQDFGNFHQDMFPTWKTGLTLDRKNNDGNYEFSNCRWATHKEQQNNRSNNRKDKE